MLTTFARSTPHQTHIQPEGDWNATRTGCLPGTSLATPTSAQDLASRVVVDVGNLRPGESTTVRFQYGRMYELKCWLACSKTAKGPLGGPSLVVPVLRLYTPKRMEGRILGSSLARWAT